MPNERILDNSSTSYGNKSFLIGHMGYDLDRD